MRREVAARRHHRQRRGAWLRRDTGFWDGKRETEFFASRVDIIPAGRPGTPAEVAEAVAYLASPEAGFTTGQVLGVHGGTVLARS